MRQSQTTTLTILDPTSLLGRDLAVAVARALPDVRLRWFHTQADPESLIVEIGGEAALVPPLGDPGELAGSTAVVVTTQPDAGVAERLLRWLADNTDVVLLDCTQPGVGRGRTRGVFDRLPDAKPSLPWYHLAHPAVAAPVRFVGALVSLEPRALHLTALCPVACLGAEALDELAQQGAARLSGMPVRRPSRLPAALAFDVAPAPPDRARALEAELGDLFPGLERTVHLIDAGLFHGHAATLHLQCGTAPTHEHVRGLLRAAGGFHLVRRDEVATTTRAVEQGTTITCGGLHVTGGWIGAWLLADGMAVGGTGAALEILKSLSV